MEFRTTIPPTLVKELSEAYPDTCPGLAWTDREIWFRAGQVSVVNRLKEAMEDQANVLSPLREA